MQNSHQPQTGLVISYFGNSVAVECDDGQVFQCHLRRNQTLPVVGDTVKWQLNKGGKGLILEIIPRRSVLARGDGRGKQQLLAANVDTLVIVMAPAPIFSEYLVDRYLIAAELLNLNALLVLNKSDLLTIESLREMELRLQPYKSLNYPTLFSSIYDEQKIQELAANLAQQTAVLVGPSGVGKSSIIAKLSDDEAIRIGDVTTKGAGKHTTTATRLYHLSPGIKLIDSPGVREFALWPITKQEILKGFKEFKSYAADCKFRDCSHVAEPGCAVKAALEAGKISQHRYASYMELLKSST